jgi:hypothetical protein
MVAQQMMASDAVQVGGKSVPVRRTSTQHVKAVSFTMVGAAGRKAAATRQLKKEQSISVQPNPPELQPTVGDVQQ